MNNPIFTDLIPGASHWSLVVPAGHSLTLTDLEGGANVSMLFYNPQNLLERYNAPDSLKCQHTFKLTTGNCLYSDMGRIFCSIVRDDTQWIDTVGGVANKNKVDLAANLNLFSKTFTDDEGNLAFAEGHSKAGDTIELRFEMDTLVVFTTCPHPMNPAVEYPNRPVEVSLSKAAPLSADDSCLNHRPENARGFENNQRYLAMPNVCSH